MTNQPTPSPRREGASTPAQNEKTMSDKSIAPAGNAVTDTDSSGGSETGTSEGTKIDKSV